MHLHEKTSILKQNIKFMFKEIPSGLKSGSIHLTFEKIVAPTHPSGETVPFYSFNVINKYSVKVGHINFRVGETRHVNMCAGHIGYGILPEHRGHSYSYFACLALAPFIRRHYPQVILTADPENLSSIRIIEKLGARFLNEIEVPLDDPAYEGGARRKKRYEWVP